MIKQLFLIFLLPLFASSQNILLKKKGHRSLWVKSGELPPQPLTASVTDHRYDAQMTFTQQTDQIGNGFSAAEMYGFKNNVRLGAFATNLQGGTTTGLGTMEQSGIIRFDVYIGTQHWKNPITGTVEVIPDYNSNVWTSAGETYFNVSIGSKLARTPNPGQEQYDVTHPVVDKTGLGFDFATNTMGENNLDEWIGVITNQQTWFSGQMSRISSAGSYSNGRDESKILNIPYYLAARNSAPGLNTMLPFTITDTAHTYYGFGSAGNRLGFPDSAFTRTYFASYPNSIRYWDLWHSGGETEEDATTYFTQQIGIAFNAKGWFRDFSHWHFIWNDNTMETFDEELALVRSLTSGNLIWTCSNGEAIEYMFARACVDTVLVIQQGDSIIIDPVFLDPFEGQTLNTFPLDINKEALNTPISVKIDVGETSLAGKNLQSSYGKLLSQGSDVWIVEVPFNKTTGQFDSVSIKEAANTDDIFIASLPVIQSANIVTTTLTVTTDIPTRAVLFRKTDTDEWDVTVVSRSNTLSTSHNFTVSGGNDYYVGVISEFGMAVRSTLINN